jgi:MFS family permease
MYSLLTPIRYVLNPRFQLTTPLQSGLFYIAPGCGYLLGTFFGGRYADRIVKKYIKKRGQRIAEDRLRSCIIFLGGVIPACMIIYGWSVEKAVGGVALPVLMMFLQGVAQLFCFPSLNTYCLDVMQGRSAEVIGKSSSIPSALIGLHSRSWQLLHAIHLRCRRICGCASWSKGHWSRLVLYHQCFLFDGWCGRYVYHCRIWKEVARCHR